MPLASRVLGGEGISVGRVYGQAGAGSASADRRPLPDRTRVPAGRMISRIGRLRAGHARLTGGVRIASPALQGLVALVIYLAVWVLAGARPLVVHLGQPRLLPGGPSGLDPDLFTWCLRWWPYAIGHGLNPLHTALIGAPAGYRLAWVPLVPALALPAAPLTLTAGPVVAFNLLVAASLPLSGWAAFVLCRRLTGCFWPALAAGAVYGFSAYETTAARHGDLNLMFSLLLPLMAYLVVAWRDRAIGSPAFVALLGLAMAAQFYLYLETFTFMTAVWVLALLVGYALAGRDGRPAVARLGLLVGLSYLLAVVLAAPYLAAALAHVPPGFARPSRQALDLAGLVVPADRTFGLGWLAHYAGIRSAGARASYVGIPLMALAVAFAIATWSRKITKFLLVLFVLLILVGLGPAVTVEGRQIIGLPWARLWRLPVASDALPQRVMVFAFLVLAVIVALWLAGPPSRRWPRWARWLLALLAIAAVVADTPALSVSQGPGLPAFIATGEYRQYLVRGETVVVVSRRGNAGLLWQAETDFYTRLAGGYVGPSNAARARTLPRPLTVVPQPVTALAGHRLTRRDVQGFRRFVRRAEVGAILVDSSSAGRWPGILRKLGLRGRAVGGVIIYRTASWARHRG